MTDFSLLQDFIVETVEHLEEMETHLLRLETDADNRETLDHIFRSVHTIKGASDYLGIEGLAELSHKLEDLLAALRRHTHPVNRELIDLLLAVRDRMGLLVKDLESAQTEQTAFADLAERLLLMRAGIGATPNNTAASPANTAASDLALEDHHATDEEAYDEELYTIFLDQLAEGLAGLKAETAALKTAARDDRTSLLDKCLSCMDPLRSSANYMGYDSLVSLYDEWTESIRNAREHLDSGDDSFLSDFIRDDMEAQIAAVTARFPRLCMDAALAVESAADQKSALPLPSSETPTATESNLPDGAYHDAGGVKSMPETSFPTAETFESETDDTTDLFDRLSHSFDDHRQQGIAPMRATETTAIAAELFSVADGTLAGDETASPETTLPVETATTDGHDHVEIIPLEPQTATPAEEIHACPTTATCLDDSAGEASTSKATRASEANRDNYDEEYDEELFRIFLEQLEENLSALKSLADALADAASDAQGPLLDACLTHIEPLRSSANYMGYTKLTALYDAWSDAVGEARRRYATEEDQLLGAFVTDTMESNIAAVVERFPEIKLETPTGSEPIIVPSGDFGDTPEDFAPLPEALEGAPETTETTDGHVIPAPTDDGQTEDAPLPCHHEEETNEAVEDSLLQDFLVETAEHLEEMEGSLLALEKDAGRQDTLDDIFRSAHTIKGAAEYLGLIRIADLAHQLENLLDQMRRNARPVDRETIDLLIAARDRMGLLAEELAQSGQEQTSIDDLLERIQNLQEDSSLQTMPPAEGIEDELPSTKHQDTEALDFDLPLFADPNDDTGDPKDSDTAGQLDDADDNPGVISITPAIEAAAQFDRAIAAAEQPESADRRDPDRTGRRKSDGLGSNILKQSIRVDAAKIDALMNQVGELVVSRAWFAQLFNEMRELQQNLKQRFKLETREMKQVKGLTFRLSEATVALGRVANELQEGVMKVRMLPIAQLFNRYPRLVFDLVRDTDKQVELDIRGEDTELDKMVIEEISDPLIHIIRNAVDHGVEPVEERRRQGKPETAVIRLEAYHEGNHVVIEIADDGRGLDLDRIRAKALAGNFATRDELERMPLKELSGLIMLPGFSTAEKVTHTSGRGVGMDVVKKNIEKLNGTIEIDTTPGIETRFRIKIPLTLAIIPALLIKVRQELFTIPLATVEETLRISEGDINTIEGVEVMQLRESTLPLVRLDGLFRMAADAPADRSFVVVVSTGIKRVGLVVDELLGQEEVVIKPLEDYLQEHSGFSGATILGDGRISLILDVYELVNLSIDREAKKKTKMAAL